MAALDKSDHVVGTIRMILNSPLGLPALKQIAAHYQDKNPCSSKIAEVSRFALTRAIRGKAGSHGFRELEYYLNKVALSGAPVPVAGLDNRVIVLLGLIHQMFAVMQQVQISEFYIMTERRLWVLLKRQGIRFHQVSPEINYHGQRACYLARVKEVAEPILGFRRALAQALVQTATDIPPFQLASLLAGESFDIAGIRFQTVASDNVLEKVLAFDRTFWAGDKGVSTGVGALHLAAIDRTNAIVGSALLILDPNRTSKKVGAFQSLHVSTLDSSTSFRERRRALIVAFGLMRLLYWVSKDLRLTRWKAALPGPLIDTLASLGIRVGHIENDVFSLSLSNLEGLSFNDGSLQTLMASLLTKVHFSRRPTV